MNKTTTDRINVPTREPKSNQYAFLNFLALYSETMNMLKYYHS